MAEVSGEALDAGDERLQEPGATVPFATYGGYQGHDPTVHRLKGATMRIAIIGCGTLGEAILGGLLVSGTDKSDVVATVRRKEHADELARLHGVTATTDTLRPGRSSEA